MKKIILGCAAVLLSLGLLAGCNNKESDKAVSIKVDTAATVVVGESLELPYTVEPEKAEIEVLNNHEEYVTAVAQEGTLYLEGLSAGSATVTLVGTYKKYTEANVSIAVTVVTKEEEDTEPGLPEIELVVDPISEPLIAEGDLVQVTYSVNPEEAEIEMKVANEDYATVAYLEPDEEDPDESLEEAGWYLTPVAEGETTLTVTASLDEYKTASVEVAIKVHAAGWEPLTTQTDYTLTFTFADAIPTYADAYITGCLNGGTDTSGGWVDYVIGSTGKMTISEDRYTVSYTFSTVSVGDIAINIYFEYNNSATYHDAATVATWSHKVFEGDVTWTEISDDEDVHETVILVEVDPSTIITDNNDFCELTVAIKDTGASGFATGSYPQFYHWVSDASNSAFVSMTQGACGEYTTSSDYYFTVKAEGVSDGGSSTYRISQGDTFEFQISTSAGTDAFNDAVTIASSATVAEQIEAYDSSRKINVKGEGTNCESALVVLEFDFSALTTNGTWTDTPYNTLITQITYVSNWNVA